MNYIFEKKKINKCVLYIYVDNIFISKVREKINRLHNFNPLRKFIGNFYNLKVKVL